MISTCGWSSIFCLLNGMFLLHCHFGPSHLQLLLNALSFMTAENIDDASFMIYNFVWIVYECYKACYKWSQSWESVFTRNDKLTEVLLNVHRKMSSIDKVLLVYFLRITERQWLIQKAGVTVHLPHTFPLLHPPQLHSGDG